MSGERETDLSGQGSAGSTRGGFRTGLRWLAVAASFALGLAPSFRVATGREGLPRNDISSEERAFAGIGRLVPDARIGWVLPSPPPPGVGMLVLISRYALLPRSVGIVTLSECQAGRAACAVDDPDVALIPHFPDYDGVPGAVQLGFDVERARDRYVVVGKRRR